MHIFREERQVYATMRACSEALQKARSLRDAIKGTALFPVGDSLRHKEEVLVEQERSADAEMAVCYQKMLRFLGEEANHADITERKMLQDYILRQFAQERVEDQAIILANKAISLHDRHFLFATLSAKQKRAVCRRGKITDQDVVTFLEDSVGRLAQQEVHMTVLAVSLLSLVALVVCASLVLAGPLGGILAMGTVAVATVLCHYAATRVAQLGAYTHTIQSLCAQLRKPDLVEHERNGLMQKLYYARRQRLEQFFKLLMMVVMCAVILVMPPPITLSIVGVLLVNVAGNYLERYAEPIENSIIRVALFGLARVLQLPVALPRWVFMQGYGLGKRLMSRLGLLSGQVATQQPVVNKTQAFVAEGEQPKKQIVRGVVADVGKEEFEKEKLQDVLSASLHAGLHMSGGHTVLVLFDLVEQVQKVRTYYQQSQERKMLTGLTEDLVGKYCPKMVRQDAQRSRNVEDLQSLLSQLKINRTYMSKTLPEDMARWHEEVALRFQSWEVAGQRQDFLPQPSPLVREMDAKIALVEAKRYLYRVQTGLLQKGTQMTDLDKQAEQQAKSLVVQAQSRVGVVTKKVTLVSPNLEDTARQTGALQVESFFKEAEQNFQRQEDVIVQDEKPAKSLPIMQHKDILAQKKTEDTLH